LSGPGPGGPSVERRALVAAGITVVLWASAFVGIRAVAETFSPGAIALGRLAVAVIALTPLLWRQGWRPIARRDLVLIATSGVFWYALYFVVLNEAERHVDAGTAAVLVNTGPIFIALLAGLFLGEGLAARLVVGLAVAFVGAAVVGLGGDPSAGTTSVEGIVLCLVAAASYAVGVTLQKRPAATVPALQLTWLACFVGFVACLPFLPALLGEAAAAPPDQTSWLVYLGIFPTAVGFTTWAYALRHTTAGRLGATTYLVAPVVVLIAWVLLGELPPVASVVGGVICITGVAIVRTPSLRMGWLRRRDSDLRPTG
jgi:drug/metabolite transporter (DMT)-like permease